MKITSVELSPAAEGRPRRLIVLRTDAARSGVAEIALDGLPESLEGPTTMLSALLVGRDPFDIQALAVNPDIDTESTALSSVLVAAAVTAMADITGQELGVPAHQLLGGRVRDEVRACAIAWGGGQAAHDAIRSAALDVVDMGFTALRVEPFAGRRDAGPGDLPGAVEMVRAIRDALPDTIDLVVDGSVVMDVDVALDFARLMAPLEVLWVELPTDRLPPDVLRDVAHRFAVPVCAARGTGEARVHDLVNAGVVDHVVVDVGLAGGLLAARRISALAEIDHVGIVPAAEGTVSLAAALHLAAAIPNLTMVEMRPGLATVEDGMVAVDLRPGLGIEHEPVHAEVA
jgi:galactonate dehydratase